MGLTCSCSATGEQRLIAVEVKATFRSGRWPGLFSGIPAQMATDWLDKPDNSALADWQLASNDLYGGLVAINFRDLGYRAALTRDFNSWHPVEMGEQLGDLAWLDTAS